jgi:hypothetical protein
MKPSCRIPWTRPPFLVVSSSEQRRTNCGPKPRAVYPWRLVLVVCSIRCPEGMGGDSGSQKWTRVFESPERMAVAGANNQATIERKR